MRSRARAPRKPIQLLKGMKVYDGMTGEQLFLRDGYTRIQRGMYVHKTNFDTMTTQMMEEALLARLR